jgi:hypothetical protein
MTPRILPTTAPRANANGGSARGYQGAGRPLNKSRFVDLNHALGEGEGFSSVAEWRAGHEQFWYSAEMRQALGDPAFKVGDDTLVVASEFRLIQE